MGKAEKKTVNNGNSEVIKEIDTAEPTVFDDEAEAAKEKARREAQIAEDMDKPFDPEALLEVRHLRKCFPIKKSILVTMYSLNKYGAETTFKNIFFFAYFNQFKRTKAALLLVSPTTTKELSLSLIKFSFSENVIASSTLTMSLAKYFLSNGCAVCSDNN